MSAKRVFMVKGDTTARVTAHVAAETPQEAVAIARKEADRRFALEALDRSAIVVDRIVDCSNDEEWDVLSDGTLVKS